VAPTLLCGVRSKGIRMTTSATTQAAYTVLAQAADEGGDFASWLTELLLSVVAHTGGISPLLAEGRHSRESTSFRTLLLVAGGGDLDNVEQHRRSRNGALLDGRYPLTAEGRRLAGRD
jgi:hypothetical protein